jgi:hypothetical protein
MTTMETVLIYYCVGITILLSVAIFALKDCEKDNEKLRSQNMFLYSDFLKKNTSGAKNEYKPYSTIPKSNEDKYR